MIQITSNGMDISQKRPLQFAAAGALATSTRAHCIRPGQLRLQIFQ